MSALQLTQIGQHLQTVYEPFIDMTGATSAEHRSSRAVAALAIAERTGLPQMAAGAAVTDHSLDGGIDAVAFAADRSTLVLVQKLKPCPA
jgi:hypothetical protein